MCFYVWFFKERNIYEYGSGATVNRMTGTAASVGETLRRQTSYYAYVDKKDAEEAAYIVKKALERR